MGKTYCCPFYRWEEKRCVHCEGGTVQLPDKAAQDAYINRFCSSNPAWQNCPIAEELLNYYERNETQ